MVDESTGMAEADWSPSLTVHTDVSWPPGQYLLKLISVDGGANHVPIVVRDDQSHADLVMMSAVTTWQAYNKWGDANLYTGAGGPTDDENRSRVVTFDRVTPEAPTPGNIEVLAHSPVTCRGISSYADMTYYTERSGGLRHQDPVVDPPPQPALP